MFAGQFDRSFAVVAGLLGSGGGVGEKRGVCTGGVSSCGGSDSRLVIRLAIVPHPLLLPFGTMLQCFRRRRFKLFAPVISARTCCFRSVPGADTHRSLVVHVITGAITVGPIAWSSRCFNVGAALLFAH